MLLPKLKSQRTTWRGSIRGTVFIWMCVFLSLSLPPSHPLSLSLTLLDNWVWPKREKNNPDIENYSSLSLGTVSLEWDARAGLHWLTKATDTHLFPTLLFSEVIWVAWTHFWWEDLHHENWQMLQTWPSFPLESQLSSIYQHTPGKSLSAGQLKQCGEENISLNVHSMQVVT